MTPKKEAIVRKRSNTRNLLTGALIGAGAGLAAAILLRRRATKKERDSMLTPSEAIKLVLLVFGLLKAISVLGDDD